MGQNSGEENLTFAVFVGISQEILSPPDFHKQLTLIAEVSE